MVNDYTLMRLADARRSDLLREAEQERLGRMAQTTKGSKPARPNLFLALAAGTQRRTASRPRSVPHRPGLQAGARLLPRRRSLRRSCP